MGADEAAWGRPELATNVNFREHREHLVRHGTGEVFRYIYRHNLWGSRESVSGQGSEDAATARLRAEIPALLRRRGVRSIADVPCGDFGWLSRSELGVDSYFGGDIVPELIEHNRKSYARPSRRFGVLNLTRDPLPTADLVLCRDCLVHLAFEQIWAALRNIRASGATYLLITTFPELRVNVDVETGDWRPLNFQLAPFGFPAPAELITEGCREGAGRYADKALGLWEVAALSDILEQPATS
ncbi:class I SAM-dependent methyltransferase [Saccharopolyspora sp. ASAGF58]|uniref:class I SAM-dependent methyltransferase n=1 Tax=Saccharopolyspora sp. ASAGF58 TaxID=2719023 RepID=UPI0014402C48|nr:class I SAM-dependent methyltransferase [Saccharopolyspora sp. ASAGF58]QIZ33506.1 class I SAM-dependent methyltransferase [Saccharopolyspora sp. ASAGF58]